MSYSFDATEVIKSVEKKLADNLQDACDVLAEGMRKNLEDNIDTGELYDSLNTTVDKDTLTGTVYSNSDHALDHEFGTEDTGEYPFIRPAVSSEAPRMFRELTKG